MHGIPIFIMENPYAMTYATLTPTEVFLTLAWEMENNKK